MGQVGGRVTEGVMLILDQLTTRPPEGGALFPYKRLCFPRAAIGIFLIINNKTGIGTRKKLMWRINYKKNELLLTENRSQTKHK